MWRKPIASARGAKRCGCARKQLIIDKRLENRASTFNRLRGVFHGSSNKNRLKRASLTSFNGLSDPRTYALTGTRSIGDLNTPSSIVVTATDNL